MKTFKRFIRNQFRKKSRVYILPTAMGSYFIGLVALIFLLGVGYSNNLLLGLGLLLSSLGLFWLIEAHFWMANFKFQSLHLLDAEARTPMIVKLQGIHPQRRSFFEKIKSEIELVNDEIYKVEESKNVFHINPESRGLYNIKFLKISSDGFLGLFRSWRFFKIDEKFWVYPTQITHTKQQDLANSYHENNFLVKTNGKDFHRQYVPGDDAKRIDWKRWAKDSELYVFSGEDIRGYDETHIEISRHSPTLENDLSLASYLITQFYHENRKYKLSIDQESGEFDSGESHFIKSMRRLAEC